MIHSLFVVSLPDKTASWRLPVTAGILSLLLAQPGVSWARDALQLNSVCPGPFDAQALCPWAPPSTPAARVDGVPRVKSSHVKLPDSLLCSCRNFLYILGARECRPKYGVDRIELFDSRRLVRHIGDYFLSLDKAVSTHQVMPQPPNPCSPPRLHPDFPPGLLPSTA